MGRIRRFARLLALIALVGCTLGAAPIRVLAPAAGSQQTWMPLTVSVDFTAAANDTTFSVDLNGTDITSAFVIGPVIGGRRTASASAVWGAHVLSGPNSLSASVEVSGVPQQVQRSFELAGDPYADAVASFSVGTNGGLNSHQLEVATGAPAGAGPFQGTTDVVSLGLSGEIVLRFDDNVIVNGDGVDFTVFENAFLVQGAGSITQPPFAEPGRVSVSQDGSNWLPFACPYDDSDAGPYWPGCAGIYPVFSDGTFSQPHASIPTDVPIEDLVGVSILTFQSPPGSGGDSFDLADVGLTWARYVRIEAAPFVTTVPGPTNAAFDIDTVAAVHSAISPPAVPGLGALASGILSTLLLGAGVARAGKRS